MEHEPTVVEIHDLATLELLNDPLRMRILSLTQVPTPVRDVAEALDVPVTRLYYHFNMMEEAGLIEVAETRKVGAMIQKLYRAAGSHYKPGTDLLANIDDPRKFAEVAAATVLDGARLDAEQGMLEMFEQYGPEGLPDEAAKTIAIGRSVFTAPKERIVEHIERLEELVSELQAEDDHSTSEDDELYSFTYLVFPVAGTF